MAFTMITHCSLADPFLASILDPLFQLGQGRQYLTCIEDPMMVISDRGPCSSLSSHCH